MERLYGLPCSESIRKESEGRKGAQLRSSPGGTKAVAIEMGEGVRKEVFGG